MDKRTEKHIEGAGKFLKATRIDHSLNLGQLAAQIGWDEAHLSDIEDDRKPVLLTEIEDIAHALDLPETRFVWDCLKHANSKIDKSEIGELIDRIIDDSEPSQ